MAAGIKATALFFAPLILIVPVNLCPPSIFIFDIKILLAIVYVIVIFVFFNYLFAIISFTLFVAFSKSSFITI